MTVRPAGFQTQEQKGGPSFSTYEEHKGSSSRPIPGIVSLPINTGLPPTRDYSPQSPRPTSSNGFRPMPLTPMPNRTRRLSALGPAPLPSLAPEMEQVNRTDFRATQIASHVLRAPRSALPLATVPRPVNVASVQRRWSNAPERERAHE